MKLHLFHLLVLAVILIVGVGTFFYAQGNRSLQLAAGVSAVAAYVTWGLIHHAIQGDLYPKIVVEYILIGAIATVLLLTMAL